MTPGARLQAAIEVLDKILSGTPAEQSLTNWARASRYAGSGDRQAVRNHVYGALRCKRSFSALGGGLETGRALMIGMVRAADADLDAYFTALGHAPARLSTLEAANAPPGGLAALPENVALDCPDWLAPRLHAALGADFAPIMALMRQRAPVFVRVNLARWTREDAQAHLATEGVTAVAEPLADSALRLTAGETRLRSAQAYLTGGVELQDAASQAVAQALPLTPGARVLDYCAGGGGKALAMAARMRLDLTAHDIAPGRMRDLPQRAERAGVRMQIARSTQELRGHGYDLVLADAPCSGSGTWRRAPDAKWQLTPARLQDLCATQDEVLTAAARFVAPAGALAYATCSMLEDENDGTVARFLARHHADAVWRVEQRLRLTPLDGGDGFFLVVLRHIA